MATKLQELLEELKELKRYTNAIDIKGYSHFIEQGNGKIIMKTDLEELIAKYTETTPTYKAGDKVFVIDSTKKHFKGKVFEIVKFEIIGTKGMWQIKDSFGAYWMYENEIKPY